MRSRMLGPTRNLYLTIAALLAIAAPAAIAAVDEAAVVAPTPAAATAPANTATEAPLEELDEILVRGRSLIREIADAEDGFFKLFNKLNQDDDYDTSCVYLALDASSQIKSRTCIPGFVADAMADQVYFAEQCKAPVDEAGNPLSPPPCFTPPPPQLVLLERSDAYAAHLMKLIKGDPRLGDMAGRLDNLYTELNSVQRKYIKVRTDQMPEKTTRHELGPRVH
jgi:hypothetical protein